MDRVEKLNSKISSSKTKVFESGTPETSNETLSVDDIDFDFQGISLFLSKKKKLKKKLKNHTFELIFFNILV
jgi:hypothetical protein